MPSDTSDEENLEFLREAQDSQFINDSMFSGKTETTIETVGIECKESLASLRKSNNEDNQFNLFQVTPGFANYISKQLSEILDKQLKYSLSMNKINNINRKKCRKGGIKLLSDSKYYLDSNVLDMPADNHNKSVKRLKSHGCKKLQGSCENSLKEIVVSGEDILKKCEVQFWSKRSKAPVFEYKMNENGQLVLIEPKFK